MISSIWLGILPLFGVFVINNWFLARYLLRKKYVTYTVLVVAVIVAMLGLNFVGRRFIETPEDRFHPRAERSWQRMSGEKVTQMPMPDKMGEPAPDKMDEPAPDEMKGQPPEGPRKLLPGPDRKGEKDLRKKFFILPFFPGPFYSHFILSILIVGFNIAVKLMFKSLRDEEMMKELERHNLQSELEYLKYQINPHFFMNTLNNIHALVDLDSEKAKTSILELSKMMRYVLYESSNKTVSLSREIKFLINYIELMRLRYTDKVSIEVSMPGELPNIEVPPLLFISFIENAFKHGVSYQKDSFIHVCMQVEDQQLLFQCSNSNWKKGDGKHCGIGLENIRKRLRLLYGEDYVLSIEEVADCYNVLLIIPITA